EGGVQLPFLNVGKQAGNVTLPLLLGRTQGQGFVDDGTHGEFVYQPTKHAHHGDRAPLAAGVDGLTQSDGAAAFHQCLLLDAVIPVLRPGSVSFHTYAFNATVRATATRHFLECFVNINFFIVDDFRLAMLDCHLQPFRDAVDGDDALRTHQPGGNHGHQPNPATAPDCHHVTFLYVCKVCPHVARGYCIGNEYGLLIAYTVGNLEGIHLPKRHPDIVCMASGIASEG